MRPSTIIPKQKRAAAKKKKTEKIDTLKNNTKDNRENIKNKTKEETPVQFEDIKNIFDHVVKPEERTLKNYASPAFWMTKHETYKKIRQKEKQDLNIYQVLYDGAKPSIEYYILNILSCVIATVGLIQGSSATIIGAMIVAPLMTPILAFSLGVIRGDITLIRISASSIFKGVILSILISALVTAIIPLPDYTHEIISRTRPTLFDIIVALASGIVGAYGYANKKISNTIIGIAIAVALMPPLCTIGIGIGTLNWQIASGATLLFLINLVSISLAGAAVFWRMQIHPVLADKEEVKKRAMSQIVVSGMILMAIAIPVGFFMYEGYTFSQAKEFINQTIEEEIPECKIFQLHVKRADDSIEVDLILTGKTRPDIKKITAIKNYLTGKNPKISTMQTRFIHSDTLTE